MKACRLPPRNMKNGEIRMLKEYYKYMLSYSPYDNVKAQKYPNMLCYCRIK